MGLPEGQAPEHQLLPEEKSKGGASLSPMKILANSVRKRKYCTMECPFSDVCPMLPLSMAKDNIIQVGEKIKHPCKLKDAPSGVQRRIKNLFLEGEEGLLTEIRNALFVAGQGLSTDVKERLAYSESLMKLHKTIYGEKSNIGNSEPFTITVRQFHAEGRTAQDVKIERQEAAAKLLEKNAPILIEDDPDPESLITSPLLEAIIAKPKPDEDIISYDMSEKCQN